MPDQIYAALLRQGAAACGSVPLAALTPRMDEARRAKLFALCPGCTGVVCAIYPYLAPGDDPGAPPSLPAAVARYARGADYHRVLRRAMAPAAELLREAGYAAVALADDSPLPEVYAACLAGLGVRGRNGLFIAPGYGSYVFIGCVATDAPLDYPPPRPVRGCMDCGACLRTCPVGALSVWDGEPRLDAALCLSAVSQRRGELTPSEEQALREAGMAWGCDRCQEVCPHNAGVLPAVLPDFWEDPIPHLPPEALEGLSIREIQRRYGDRAFLWRGAAVLRRNALLFSWDRD